MDEPIIVGIDVGTSKICTLIARLENREQLRILGVGIERSKGIRKGMIVDLIAATQSIERSIEKAERTSGLEVTSAIVSLAGMNITSQNNRGVVGISGRTIDQNDVLRAVDAAQAVSIPHNREVIHVIQRGFTVDGQEGIRMPIGMHAYRLEVETHIITAGAAGVQNLREAVADAGVEVNQFVLNPLASGEVVLTETARDMGVMVCDIGGGTTDMAIYIDGDVWYTMVLGVGGDHITSDIAHGLRLPLDQAEAVKLRYGFAYKDGVGPDEFFSIKPFGEQNAVRVSRKDLALIIEARVEEIFSLVLQEIKRSGYDGLLPAGMVLTGGVSALPGIREVAGRVLGIPVQIAKPDGLIGMTDRLHSPAFSTSVGLLRWAVLMSEFSSTPTRQIPLRRGGHIDLELIKNIIRRFIP